MDIRRIAPTQLVSAACLLLIAPPAFAHDMGNVLIAYAIVFAVPLPALVGALGWKWGALATVPVWGMAFLAEALGAIGFYGVLLAPYIFWAGKALFSRRHGKSSNEV